MQVSRKKAIQRANIYQERPLIPKWVQERFPGWTHFEIRAYHQRLKFTKKTADGKKKRTRSRRVIGYIFLHLAKENGYVKPRPVKNIFIKNMTRRDFAAYARGLTINMDNSLIHAFN